MPEYHVYEVKRSTQNLTIPNPPKLSFQKSKPTFKDNK